jgi:hypothetical protein
MLKFEFRRLIDPGEILRLDLHSFRRNVYRVKAK